MEGEDSAAAEAFADDSLSLDLLIEGAHKALANADALFGEAELLAAHGATARALCLHQISIEECSKVDYLGTWAMGQLLDEGDGQKEIGKAFRSHAAKNKLNAYMLEPSEEEINARESGDWNACSMAFKAAQNAFHERSNRNKNDALYVDWTGKAFVAPVEAITPEMLAEITALNAKFLGYARLGTRMFETLKGHSGALKPHIIAFAGKMEKLRNDKPEDMIEAGNAALAELLEEMIAETTKK